MGDALATLPTTTVQYSAQGKYTVKNVSHFPIPSRDVTNQTLPSRELLNYSRLGRVWLVTSRLVMGKSLTFFTVYM
jgi:hypothetical protein